MQPDWQDNLKQWARRHSADPERLDAIRGRALARIAEAPAPEPPPAAPTNPWPGRIGWMLAGAAATLACVSLLRPGPDPNPASELAAHDPVEPLAVFREIEAMFPGQAEWLSSLGDDVSMGLRDRATDAAQPGYCIQYTVLSRTGDGAWQVAWRGDVVTRRADVRLGDGQLSLFVQPLEEGLFAVEQELDLRAAPVRFATEGLRLMREGDPVVLAQIEDADRSWRLVQSLSRFGAES